MSLSHSPSIVTNGLVFCLDAANSKSYPGTGTDWTDLSGNQINGILTNGPAYNSSNGGSIVFDGINDYINFLQIYKKDFNKANLFVNYSSISFFKKNLYIFWW
jgi:hypothetical protein